MIRIMIHVGLSLILPNTGFLAFIIEKNKPIVDSSDFTEKK